MKKAFSLIELSIVILTIGILIAGVTQSSRLLHEAKIRTAQTLTQSSPVAEIEGLSVWFEPTLSESFISSQTEEGQLITQWNDINPQAANKLYLINSAESTREEPTPPSTSQFYSESNGPAGLPSVYFGTDGVLQLVAKPSETNGNIIALNSLNKTIFLVSMAVKDSPGGLFIAIGKGISFSRNIAGVVDGEFIVSYSFNADFSGNTYPISYVTEIGSITMSGQSSDLYNINVYLNGSLNGSGESSTIVNYQFVLGTNSAFYVSELIVYERVLKDEERQSVEQYLSKKYGVKVIATATPAP